MPEFDVLVELLVLDAATEPMSSPAVAVAPSAPAVAVPPIDCAMAAEERATPKTRADAETKNLEVIE